MNPKRRQRRVVTIDPERVMDVVRALAMFTEQKITHATIMAKLQLSGSSGSVAGYKLTAVLGRLRKEGRLRYFPLDGWHIP